MSKIKQSDSISHDIKLESLSNYVDNIKAWAYKDVVHLQNSVLNKNPYTSEFINNTLLKRKEKKRSLSFILKAILIYYAKNLIIFISYCVAFSIYKFFSNSLKCETDKNTYLIDVFVPIDDVILQKKFKDKYFPGVCEVLEKNGKNVVFLPRLYSLNRNPLKIYRFLKVLRKDEKNKFVFEYELLNIVDLAKILLFIFKYPFRQFELLQFNGNDLDGHFNYELFNSLKNTSFDAYTRYLVGRKISSTAHSLLNIISWQEFQGIEKTFYKGVGEVNDSIYIYGCEFLVKYKGYIGMNIKDVDVDLKITPSVTLLNGTYNYSDSSRHLFRVGASLRYKKIFSYCASSKKIKDPLVLLGYGIQENIDLLGCVSWMDNITIKAHPVVSINNFKQYIKPTWKIVNNDIYDEFNDSRIALVSSMSGSALEAVACGVSVIIVSDESTITVAPLLDYGRGKVWDVAFSQNEVKLLLRKLENFKLENRREAQSISAWYKENFFIEPTEKAIEKMFNL